MTTLFTKTKLYIYYLIGTFLALPFLFGWISHAAEDLLWQAFSQTEHSDTSIELGKNVQTVWNKVIKWSFDVGIGGWNSGFWKSPSIIVKVTRLLLILTIALSVTMILYNGMIYIIETWQWKEWKSLIKNVWLIVVWILVSLFSVVIINIIQSIPTTIEEEMSSSNQIDNQVLKWSRMSWSDFRDSIVGRHKSITRYTVRVNYVYSEWGTAAPSKTKLCQSGDVYKFISPAIQYYTADIAEIGGTVTWADLSFTVTYTDDGTNTPTDSYTSAEKEQIINTAKEYFMNKFINNEINKEPFTWKDKNWNEVRFVYINWRKMDMIEAYLWWE